MTTRPRTDRTERLEMRLTPEEKKILEKAAEYTGTETAVAIRAVGLEWARRTLEGRVRK